MPETESSKRITGPGLYDLARIAVQQGGQAVGWEVRLWCTGVMLFAPWFSGAGSQAVSVFQSLLGLVAVDADIQEHSLSAYAVPSAGHWVSIGPRGARLVVFGRSVTVSLKVGDFSSINPPSEGRPVNIAARITSVVAPPSIQRGVLLTPPGGLFTDSTVNAAWQLPMFSSEFRVHGTYADAPVFLYDGTVVGSAPRVLEDAQTNVSFTYEAGQLSNWTPLHPMAAGIGVGPGVPAGIVETR